MNIDIVRRKQEFKNIMLYGFKDLENEDEILLGCLGKGYRDMTTARTTFKGIGEIFEGREEKLKKDREQNESKETETYRESYYKKIVEIVKNNLLCKSFSTKEDFNNAHNNCCNEIIKKFHKEFAELYKDGREFYYGSAQKLINMTLKYFLLAAEDYSKENLKEKSIYTNIKINEPFLHCPIDSIVIEVLNKERTLREIKDKIKVTWSTMNKEIYLNLQKEIESYIGNQSKLNYDFEVWNRKSMIDKK